MKSWDLHVCHRASMIKHVDPAKKVIPARIWLCSNVTIWSSQTCFSVIFIHIVIISNYLEKVHLFTLFSITSHCFSLFLVSSKNMSVLLPFKARHSNDKVFLQGWWGFDMPILHSRIIFPMYIWCATRNAMPDSTDHLVDLKSVTKESRNVSPCMTPWSRVNWKMCDGNSTFACIHAICTQFSITWPHSLTVHDFLAVLTDPDCRHESDFSQRDGTDSSCGRRVQAVRNKTPEQTLSCFDYMYGPP